MHVTTTSPTPTSRKLVITADTKELVSVKSIVLQRLAQGLKVPGFREGKVPLTVAEKQLDPLNYQNEFLQEAINRIYVAVIEKQKLRPVNTPQVTVTKFVPFSTLEFSVEVDVVGDIKVANYKKIKREAPQATVSSADVAKVLHELALKNAERADVARAAKDGDQVWIDFSGVDARGQSVPGADGKDYPLLLGSNTFIKGFEPALVGLKAGEQKTFTVTFPKDYGVKALQSKKVTFSVTIKKVQEVKAPSLDDALAAKLGPFTSLGDLKDQIKRELLSQRQYEAQLKFQDELVREIAEKSELAVPTVLIEEQVLMAEREEKQNILYRGQTWEEHLKEEGVTEEQHRAKNRPVAEQRVKAGLVLSEIAELEDITVSESELDERLASYRAQHASDQRMQQELQKPENRRDIRHRLLVEKTVAKLVEYATNKA